MLDGESCAGQRVDDGLGVLVTVSRGDNSMRSAINDLEHGVLLWWLVGWLAGTDMARKPSDEDDCTRLRAAHPDVAW
jgi:hypothetical protein